MRRDLVEARDWITGPEYERGLAIAAVCPGPLACQLAVYCGYVRFGVPGGLAVAVFTILATPLLLRHAGNPRLRGFLRGITLAVVGVLVGTTYLVGRSAIGDALTAAIAVRARGRCFGSPACRNRRS